MIIERIATSDNVSPHRSLRKTEMSTQLGMPLMKSTSEGPCGPCMTANLRTIHGFWRSRCNELTDNVSNLRIVKPPGCRDINATSLDKALDRDSHRYKLRRSKPCIFARLLCILCLLYVPHFVVIVVLNKVCRQIRV